MKLTSVFLLFLFSCVVFYVGAVSTISAEEDHDAAMDLPYIAEAHAYRRGGVKQHVILHAKGTSDEQGINGGFRLSHYRVIPGVLGWDLLNSKSHIETHGGNIDGSFHEELDLPYKNEPNRCVVWSHTWGKKTNGVVCNAFAEAEVGPTPPLPDPSPPTPDDCPCDEVGLFSVNGLYTAAPGDSHEACITTDAPYSEIYWYVAAPGETGLGTQQEIDTGDGTTTKARFSYTFPSGAMHTGTYKITAYVYRSDLSVYWEDYTVDVSVD